MVSLRSSWEMGGSGRVNGITTDIKQIIMVYCVGPQLDSVARWAFYYVGAYDLRVTLHIGGKRSQFGVDKRHKLPRKVTRGTRL